MPQPVEAHFRHYAWLGTVVSKGEKKFGRAHGGAGGAPVRIDASVDEGRPLAEIRRSLHGLLSILIPRRWVFFVPFCLVSSVAFLASLYYPRAYSATTLFERRNDPIMLDLPLSAGAAASFNYFRSTMHNDLTSMNTMLEVVENLGLTKNVLRNADGTLTDDGQRQARALAQSLGSRLTVGSNSPSAQVDVIAITYTGPDPGIGRRLVEEVKRVYIRRMGEWTREFLEKQREYFLAEVATAQEELKLAQREETRLRLEYPYVNPTDPGAVTTQLSQLAIERRELLRRRREHQAEWEADQQALAALGAAGDESSLGAGPDAPVTTPEDIESQAKLSQIRREIEELRATRGMTDEHPRIKQLFDDARRIEVAMQQRQGSGGAGVGEGPPLPQASPAPRGIMSAALAPIISERARLRAQVDAAEMKITDIDADLQSNELTTAEFEKAKDRVFENQEQFNEVIGRVTKARQRVGQLETTLMAIEPAINAVSQDRLLQFSDTQPARSSVIPVTPKATTVLLLAVLAGVGAGVVCVVLAEVFDHVFHNSSHVVRSLGLPILEAIDEIITAQDHRRLLIRRVVATPLVLILLAGSTGLTGSMAYLSLQRPWTYQRLKRVPETAAALFGFDIGRTSASADSLP
jgi:uncharacterized protein involved in exopolysaccharide biosynthesis